MVVTKVIKNKDGKMETIDVPDTDPHALEKLHKEVRDMLDGNIQFHDDPYKQVDHTPVEHDDTDDYGGFPYV
jgi:hypothetical protein